MPKFARVAARVQARGEVRETFADPAQYPAREQRALQRARRGSRYQHLLRQQRHAAAAGIRNNYIGLDPGGAVPQPIGNDGIAIVDSSYIQIIGNVIDGGVSGITISGASAYNNVIRSNKIGIDAYGGQGASAANGEGIVIYNQADFNEIGVSGGKSPSNTIANNDYAGVRIDATAGTANTIRPNSIYNNGKSGSGLGIDIGALGPLENDPLDGDGGGNGSQNSPRLNASVPNADTSRTLGGKLNSLPNAQFRIDVYRSPACAGGNRGDAKTFLPAQTATGGIDATTDQNGLASSPPRSAAPAHPLTSRQ